jgi:hypothetical protein
MRHNLNLPAFFTYDFVRGVFVGARCLAMETDIAAHARRLNIESFVVKPKFCRET